MASMDKALDILEICVISHRHLAQESIGSTGSSNG